IMPVHVYGNPCDTEKIQAIADKYGLKVIYDAAHSFGVTVNGESILKSGEMSTLSFHATKTYNTIEGGALVCHDEKTKQRIDYLKNFGFAGETTVVAPGINGKMDEVRSSYGLLELKYVDDAIEKRKQVALQYRKALKDVVGINCLQDIPGVRHNYSYFPIFVDEAKYGMSRDELYDKLKDNNIYGRRYFYPLISEFPTYRGLESSNKDNLPVSHKIADSVICLPMHHELLKEDLIVITNIVKEQK
ncbi:MAG: DegT/DnrJ/EryC1/StrS family aminotransferase, partial [Tissierellia bacterium]|nr:DegT/DnrJ/EryC1/StrS family aminotransferase [Tissierellia bacterium]